jgi:hypothetical protein
VISLRKDVSSLQVKTDAPKTTGTDWFSVVVIPEGAASRPLSQRISAGQQAYFNLPPGRYSVFAFPDGVSVEYGSSDVMKKFIPQATTVTLKPQQTANITVAVARETK